VVDGSCAVYLVPLLPRRPHLPLLLAIALRRSYMNSVVVYVKSYEKLNDWSKFTYNSLAFCLELCYSAAMAVPTQVVQRSIVTFSLFSLLLIVNNFVIPSRFVMNVENCQGCCHLRQHLQTLWLSDGLKVFGLREIGWNSFVMKLANDLNREERCYWYFTELLTSGWISLSFSFWNLIYYNN